MSRKQRRALRAVGGKNLLKTVEKAQKEVSSALQNSNFDQLPQIMAHLEEQTNRAAQLADALADDYETLAIEIDVVRALLKHVLGAQYHALEDAVRTRILAEREMKIGTKDDPTSEAPEG